MKTIINKVYEDDGEIDKKERSEIQPPITQLNFIPEQRMKVPEIATEKNLPLDLQSLK